SVTKKREPAPGFLDQLERAPTPAETTHLQNIRHVKKIGCIRRRVLSALDRRQQIVSLDWFRENFGVCNFKSLLGRGIIWEKQNLKRRKNFAERRTERESIDPLGFELGQEKITLLMTPRPLPGRTPPICLLILDECKLPPGFRCCYWPNRDLESAIRS